MSSGTPETTAEPRPLLNGLMWWSRRRPSGDYVLVRGGMEIGPGMTVRQAKALAEWMEVADNVPSHIADRLLMLAASASDTDRATLMIAVMLLRGPGSLPSSQSEAVGRAEAERAKRVQNLYESEAEDEADA